MSQQILQVDQAMLETHSGPDASRKSVEETLNAMLDAEADEITAPRATSAAGSGRPTGPATTSAT